MSEKQEQSGTGARMTGLQYEALCRHAISRIYGVPVGEIHGGHLAGASNSRQKIRHQIDLYWTASDGVCEYTVFANAKWTSGQKLSMKDVMLLIGVWRDIGAHKAMLITNVGFDIGVRRQAKEKGIALLIVKPVVDLSELGTTKLEAVVQQVERIAAEKGELFRSEVVHKTFGSVLGNSNDECRNSNQIRNSNDENGDLGDEPAEGGIWLIAGSEIEGIEDKALGGGEIPNKMVRGIWRKG